MKYKIVLILFFLFFVSMGFSQETDFKFNHLTIKNGLSHNNVYTLMQDNNGFMWVGTQNGLDKFDGYNFQSYYYSSEDSCSLISSGFGKLLQDSKGRIWIGTYRGGLSCYFPETDEIIHYLNDSEDPQTISSNLTRAIIEDNNGNMWFGTANSGLCKFNENDNSFTTYKNDENEPNSLVSNNIRGLSCDLEGNIWIATTTGLSKYNYEKEIFTNFPLNEKEPNKSISELNLQSIFCDKAGYTWIGTRSKGINRYNPKTKTFDYFSPNPDDPNSINGKRIQCIYEDSFGRIWIGTYRGGLNLFHHKTQTFTSYTYSENDETSMSHNKIEVIFEDNAQNLWIGTRGGGINILDLKPQKFTNFTHDKSDNTIPSGTVTSIVAENNDIFWFGTATGLCRYDKPNNKFLTFVENDSPNSLTNHRIRTLMIDNQKNIWVGTYNGGVNIIKEKDGEYIFTHFLKEEGNDNSLVSNQINALMQDNTGAFWIGTSGGLNRLEFNEKQEPVFTNFLFEKEDLSTLSNRYVTHIFQDENNNIWIATSDGLDKYLPETKNFKRYYNSTQEKTGSEINAFNTISQAENGNLWLGTDGSGFYLFNPESGEFTKYIDNTFKTSNITAILKDEQNNLWISTAKGISVFNLETEKYTYYGISDGLIETGFFRNSALKAPNGDLYFGHISGLTYIQPEKIELNQHIPKIILTEFKIFNTSYFQNRNSFCSLTPKNLKEIKLSHKDYVVSFEFASLDFTDPEKKQYKYKMEGFNDEWIEFGTKRYAMFTNLPPGKYTLKIQGSNNDGIWSNNETSLEIKVIVTPPFWKTVWFYAIVITIILLLIYTFFKVRTKKLIREKKILEQKVRERTEVVEMQKEELSVQAQELEASNVELEKLSIVASETDNSITIMDAEGNFEWVNDGFKRLYGYKSLKQFIDERGKSVFAGEFNETTKKAVSQCLKEKKMIISKDVVQGKTDDIIWIQTTWSPILDHNNNVIKLIAIDSNITELKKAEIEIINQKNELEERNYKISEQNELIKSSLRYAQTIQKAILPSVSKFEKFAEHFIIYRPKDIVSGDFYWYYETDKYHFITVSDCTGHGVSGAFMSMIGNRLLNGIVNERKIYQPNEILTRLSIEIVEALNQTKTKNRDGMDLCFVRIEKTNKKEIEVVFEGSKRELIYYKNSDKEIKRLKGSRKRVGGVLSSRINIEFENKKIYVEKGDILYISTDGYIDQCNIKRKRIGTTRLIRKLNEIIEMPLNEQKIILEKDLDNWQINSSQRDDITILAIKL